MDALTLSKRGLRSIVKVQGVINQNQGAETHFNIFGKCLLGTQEVKPLRQWSRSGYISPLKSVYPGIQGVDC